MSEHTRGFRRTWIDHTLDVDGSLGDVMALLSDLDGWSRWTPGLTAVKRRPGPARVGEKFTMMIKPASFHPPLPVPCVMFKVEPSYLEWGGGIPGSVIRHSFRLTALGPNKTSVHQLEFATNLLALATLIAEPGIYKHDLRWQKALRDQFSAS